MKNNRLDWKGVGQFMAALVQIWTIIRHVVVRQRVGLEIIDWIIGEGEQIFRTALYELTDKYNEYKESLPSGPKDHGIEFDAVPFCPAGLTIAPDSDQIKTRVRGKRNLSEISIRLHLYDGQTNGKWLNGYYLKVKLDGQEVFGAQLLDFYLEHPDLIPEDWKKKGWIYEEDPKGWFLWYCRYYMGRRIPEEDDRQIKRWINIKRHVSQIQNACAPGDLSCRPRQRQALLHWAYDSRSL